MTSPGQPPQLPDDLQARLSAAGVTDEASLQAALERDPGLRRDLEDALRANPNALRAAAMRALLEQFLAVQDSGQLLEFWRGVPTEMEQPFIEIVERLIAEAPPGADPRALENLRARLDDFRRLCAERDRAPDAGQLPPLAAALQAFLGARTWGDSRRVVKQHPELLGDEALDRLERAMTAARSQGDANAENFFREHLALLRRCREAGVAQAFAEKASSAGGPGLPEDFRDDLNRAQDAERRYLERGALAALDEAVAAWERILLSPRFAAAPQPFCLTVMNNAGGTRLRRYWARGRLEDLDDRAPGLWQQAVALTPPDSPDRAMYLNNLGNGLSDRYARTGALADLEAAIARYREACREGLQDNPDAALMSARTWLRWAVERNSWAEVAEASRSVRLASAALVAVQWERADKVSRLREVQGLAALGAYAHARVNAPKGAAEVLEAGLARLLGEALEGNRRDLERLPEAERERYRHAVERCSTVAGSPTTRPGEPALDAQRLHAERAAARAERDAAIAAIRAIPGYEDFFLPLPFDRIQAQARPARPLAYLATTGHGSAIIVVWPDRAEAALSHFAEAELNALLVETDPAGRNVTGGGYLPAQLARPDWLPAALAKLLPALGKLLGPLAERLRAGGAQGVVLIPSGRLGLLPLHAAALEEGRCLLDAFEVA